MATFDGNNFYYSGQGVVLVGDRDESGRPMGLLPVGNVSDLRIAIATSVLEHKESQTGQRGIDLRLTTETKCTLTMTMENFIAENLAMALRGGVTLSDGGTVASEKVMSRAGRVTPLAHPMVSALTTVKVGTGSPVTLDPYTNDTTAWDYITNLEAGSVMFNDGKNQLISKIGSSINAGGVALATPYVTVGNTTTFTFASGQAPNVKAGDKVISMGLAGADASILNGKAHTVVNRTLTTVEVAVNTSGKTITGTGGFVASATFEADFAYTYGGSKLVDAMTEGAPDYFLRFEGLNTADDNKPVIVEVFKFSSDPLKELALIGDGIAEFVMEGNVLADPLRMTGSKYFRQVLLR